MIVAAGLLVLLGLGLFVGGLLTGMTVLYWGCVAVCVVAAVLLSLARRSLTTAPGATAPTRGAEAGAAPRARSPRAPAGADSEAPAVSSAGPAQPVATEPPVEEVEVSDLLSVMDLEDEVLVIDEHPRYHLSGCRHIAGRTTIPIPIAEARTDGFTPCAICAPDRNLAQRARERK